MNVEITRSPTSGSKTVERRNCAKKSPGSANAGLLIILLMM
ncbi:MULTISPECIES: hypothetical protein [unclassified Caballeronia]|nr:MULTISPECIES: hypothetical protein [unclassified Caballeronia]MDR5752512.1 hypothetical protein [Caballeronia sp. LZ024]MDR5841668.1 hypothetical protein [Caballeronia sp. LZ031]